MKGSRTERDHLLIFRCRHLFRKHVSSQLDNFFVWFGSPFWRAVSPHADFQGFGLWEEISGRQNTLYGLHMSHSLNSLKGGYIGDYIGDYYRGY